MTLRQLLTDHNFTPDAILDMEVGKRDTPTGGTVSGTISTDSGIEIIISLPTWDRP